MMIKELYLLQKFARQKGEGPWHTLKKCWVRWRGDGYAGMRERLDKEFRALQEEEYVWFHRWNKRYETRRLRVLFALMFLVTAGYYMFIKSELYESKSFIVVKDLNRNSVSALGISLLGAGASSEVQDSKILEEYLRSPDVLQLLDETFDLLTYYHSDALDVLSRLRSYSTREDFLEIYRNHLHVVYNESSGILSVGFSHTDPKTAQNAMEFLIRQAERQLNVYNERNAEKQLEFVSDLVAKNRAKLDASTAELERYQNENLILDPSTDAQTQSGIIANLESSLVQKRGEYHEMQQYMTKSSFDLVKLANEIKTLEVSLKNAKASLSGSDNKRLNAILFDYEKLKAQVAFDEEVYKQSLVQLEAARIDANKQSKALVVLTQPNLPDGYTYPDKPRLFLTLLLLYAMAYGIVSLIGAIIKDHKD